MVRALYVVRGNGDTGIHRFTLTDHFLFYLGWCMRFHCNVIINSWRNNYFSLFFWILLYGNEISKLRLILVIVSFFLYVFVVSFLILGISRYRYIIKTEASESIVEFINFESLRNNRSPSFFIRGYWYRNVNNRSSFGLFFFFFLFLEQADIAIEGIEIHCSKVNNLFECLRNNCSL